MDLAPVMALGEVSGSNDLETTINKAKDVAKQIENTRKSTLLVLISPRTLDRVVAFELSDILRRMGQTDKLDVLLDSKGGNIDAAYKILLLLGSYSGQVTVVVPFFAKSAATLIALGADNLVLCKAGELGPIDPQVVDPQTGMYVPAHSIKEAMGFIEEIKDGITKVSISDRIPLLLIGAYRGAEKTSMQYLDEILDKKGFDEVRKDELIHLLTKRYFSHGYPMSRDFLIRNGIKIDKMDETTEALFADLHATWQRYLHSVDPRDVGGALILQTKEMERVIMPGARHKATAEPQ